MYNLSERESVAEDLVTKGWLILARVKEGTSKVRILINNEENETVAKIRMSFIIILFSLLIYISEIKLEIK